MNVIGGAMLGASVPFVGAFALTQATADFRLLDHLFTLIFLAIACGAIGVVINLPWGASAAMAERVAWPMPSSKATSSRRATTRMP